MTSATCRWPAEWAHPGLLTADDLDVLSGHNVATSMRAVYGYEKGWGLASAADREEIVRLMDSAFASGTRDRFGD